MAPRRQGPWVPSPSHTGVFGPPLFLLIQFTLVREYSVWWQLGLVLFGMPARGPSRPLLVGFRVAALALSPPLHGAGSH